MNKGTCKTCGVEFEYPAGRGRARAYCDDHRRVDTRRGRSGYVRKQRDVLDCVTCGAELTGSPLKRYCSSACKWVAYKADSGIPCTVCGEPTGWTRRSDKSNVTHQKCSRGPNYRESRSRRADGYVDRWNCAECGVACTRPATKGQRPKYCELCRRVRQNPLIHIRHKERLKLYERDDWVCWLCCESVDGGLIGSKSHWRPSLDHVVPRSAGGSDEPENLRLAHWWCNSVRGDGTHNKDFFEVVTEGGALRVRPDGRPTEGLARSS